MAVFDEPEAGIDLWSFQNLIRVFEHMREKNRQRSILVISHQERILQIADEIIVIADGQVHAHDQREALLPELMSNGNAVNMACSKLTGSMEKENQ